MYLKYIIFATLGLFLGINLAYSLNFSTEIFFVSLVIGFINFLIHKFSKRSFGVYKNKTPILLTFLFVFVSFGILLGQISLAKEISRKESFNTFISQDENFLGVVSKIESTEKSQQLLLKTKDNEKEKSYKIKIVTTKIPEYKAGESILVSGEVNTEKILLPKIESKINKSFNLQDMNETKEIDGEISFPKISTSSTTLKINFLENLFYKLQGLKLGLVKTLDTLVPRSVASLASGTTLGDDSLFSKQELENFRVAGLSHIIVLSGFNITILIAFLFFVFLNLRIKLKYRVCLTILGIIVFIVFVGASPSLVRAAIMGSVLLLGFLSGRGYVAKQSLFLAAFFMMLISPKIAVSNVSFHLSFLATFGILYLAPIFDQYKFFKKYQDEEEFLTFKKKILKSLLQVFKITLAVQILVLPYIAFKFGSISLFGLIANILVVPFIPLFMFLSFLIIFFSFFLPIFSTLFGYFSLIFSKYIFGVAEFVSSFSISEMTGNLSLFNLILFYLILLFYIYFEDKRFSIKKYFEKEEF